MEDNLSKIFDAYNPPLSSSGKFMSRLQRNMEIVDDLQRQLALQKRRSRKAVIAAAVTGFIFGAAAMLTFPYISAFILYLLSLMQLPAAFSVQYGDMLIWIAICLTECALAFIAYDISMLLSGKPFSNPINSAYLCSRKHNKIEKDSEYGI